jgi:hypothetical protein
MKKQEMINAFMKKTNAVLLEKGNRTIVSYDEPRNVVVWVGKQRKPVYHYIFDLEERRQLFISKQTEFGLTEQKQLDANLKKAQEEADRIQKGSILYSSWGYEQTNIDFYIVLERKPKSVVLQMVGQDKTYDGPDNGKCAPDVTMFIGEPFLKRINKWGKVNLNSYSYCGLWDGRPKNWTSWH